MELIRTGSNYAYGTSMFGFGFNERNMVAFDWSGEVTPQRFLTTMYYSVKETITFSLDRQNEPYYVAANVGFSQPSYSLVPYGDLSYQGLSLSPFLSQATDSDEEWCGLTCTLSDANGERFRYLDMKGNDTGQDNGQTVDSLSFGFFGQWAFLPFGSAKITFDLRFSIRQWNFYYEDLSTGTMTGSIMFIPEATYESRTSWVGEVVAT